MGSDVWIFDFVPRVLPPGWRQELAGDGARWTRQLGGTDRFWSVIMSGATEQDGKRWVHLSTAMPHRLPTWEELVEVRDIFIGRERKCLQVVAPASEHVNIHPHCLHLWHCVDGDALPDFTRGMGSL